MKGIMPFSMWKILPQQTPYPYWTSRSHCMMASRFALLRFIPYKVFLWYWSLIFYQLIILVKWSPAPHFPVNEEVKEKIKQVMSRRYDPTTKILNLSQFHLDEGKLLFCSVHVLYSNQIHLKCICAELCTDYYVPLNRENIMVIVMKIIGDHIPDVQAIDMSNNKIYSKSTSKHT